MRLCWVVFILAKVFGLRLLSKSPIEIYAKYYKPHIKHLFLTIDYAKSFPAIYSMFKCTRLAFAAIYHESFRQEFIEPVIDAFDRFPEYLDDVRFRNLMLGNRAVEMAESSSLGVYERLLQSILELKIVFLLTKVTDPDKSWDLVEIVGRTIDHFSFMISGASLENEDFLLIADALLRITLIIKCLKNFPANQRLIYYRLVPLQWKIEDMYRTVGESIGLNAVYYLYRAINNPVAAESFYGVSLTLEDECVPEIVEFIWNWWGPEKGNVFWSQRERYMRCQRRILLLVAYPHVVDDSLIEEMCEECMHGLIYDSSFMRYIDFLENKGYTHKSLIMERMFLRHAFFNRQIFRLLEGALSAESVKFQDEILAKSFAGCPGFATIWFDKMGQPINFSLPRLRIFFHNLLLCHTKKAWECDEDGERGKHYRNVGDLLLMCFRLRVSLKHFIALCSQTFARDSGMRKAMLRKAISEAFDAANPRSVFTVEDINRILLNSILL